VDRSLIERFSVLFRGGRIASDDPATGTGFRPLESPSGEHYPASGEAFLRAVEGHLTDPRSPIGVYPLYALYEADKTLTGHVVDWGCIDWDDGLTESCIHARNVQELLHQMGIRSWVERSRSKGYHLWVFSAEPEAASTVREGLIAACEIVDAPTREVNPKQTSLTGKGWGNGVRLPYPAGRADGRNECVENGETTIPLDKFVNEAFSERVTTDKWGELHALYRAPVPLLDYRRGANAGSGLQYLSLAIRETGPRPSPMKPAGDRSATLFSLACAMWEEGHDAGRINAELQSADKDWGNKYGRRPDGQSRLASIVEQAFQKVSTGTKKK